MFEEGHTGDVLPWYIDSIEERPGNWSLYFYALEVGGMKLTAKQQAWIDYYKQGHTATEAARLAGYKAKSDNSFQSIGAENLRKLAEYVQDRESVLEVPRIADMAEINAFWTDIMRSEEQDPKDRLKASELRARAAGGFIEKVQVSGSLEAGFDKLENVLKQLRGGGVG